ncbi:dTDP-4-dehydrorhamnose 3,5-epimerase [Parasegetibacter sp. NRK P23]|uniref:dTDP-4-dehydrorhamnose 3,5-epimerase n=1 Tax=Parasegetibacter sp. NRK P23 TaxID=2942999 RepID=UPI0020448896|nr:dTDP-4-dehydrorhamnose 3,5-epimerase [Parasegetibacter sp. NRK P23]MCM5529365.1 dTDP-4-dehydrorhamnose 3,5-epimerase [Parasegetibacter sp. NRK P23]
MPFTPTEFAGLLVFEPRVFEDNRGYFFESYNEAVFHEAGVTMKWVQDNQARSSYGVVRGLHFQAPPFTQTKLIRALQGTILDVVVDIRKEQPTYGKVFSIELSAENKKQLLVPAGFAHGYSVLSETAEVMYKCDNLYNKGAEGGLLPTDPSLAIDWKIPAEAMVLSEKDQVYPVLSQLQSPF